MIEVAAITLPPCMAPQPTKYPECKNAAFNGKDGTCSVFVAMGCCGFYLSSAAYGRYTKFDDASRAFLANHKETKP